MRWWRSLSQIGRFYFGFHPLLAETVDDAGEVLAEHLAELALDLALDELLDDGDGVEGAVDVDVLQRVGLEDERDALLAGDDEDDVRVEAELGEAEEHGDDERLFRGEHAARPAHEVDVGLFVIQRVRLGIWREHGSDRTGGGVPCAPGLWSSKRCVRLQHKLDERYHEIDPS